MPSKSNSILRCGYDILSFAGNTAAAVVDPLLTVQETALLLRCSVSSLNKWRLLGRGPHFIRVGSRVRYRPIDVAAYIANQRRASTSAERPPPAE